MPLQFNIKTIPLSAIDMADIYFKISDPRPLTPLVNSIRAVGLLVPPLVIPIDEDRYRIVSGFLRIAACRQLAMEHLIVRLPAADTPANELAWAAVSENALARELSVVEKARATALLQRYHPDMGTLSAVAGKLGLMLDAGLAAKLLHLLTLPAVVVDAVSGGSIAFATALTLEKEGPLVAQAVTNFLGPLKLGLNHQRFFLQMIYEITRRDEIGIVDFLKQPDLALIVDDHELDAKTKTRKVKDLLYRMRFPNLSAQEMRFRETADLLATEKGVRFVPPPYFEGNTIRLTLAFDSKKKLTSQSRWLQKILSSQAVDDLFDW